MAEILHGPWSEKEVEELTPSEQLKESKQILLEPLIEIQKELFLAVILFKASGDIRPLHCRKALNALEDITANTSTFCRLFTDTTSLPTLISSSRYPLLTCLHRIREQALQAIPLGNGYRVSYKSVQLQKRREIYMSLEYISNELQTFLVQLSFFDTEIQFQEKCLSALAQEEDQPSSFAHVPEGHRSSIKIARQE